MARSDKSSHFFVKVSWNAPIDTLMRFFIVIIIEERIQSFKEFSSIISRTNVNVITFNCSPKPFNKYIIPVSYTHLRAHETDSYLVCRLLLEKKKKKKQKKKTKH